MAKALSDTQAILRPLGGGDDEVGKLREQELQSQFEELSGKWTLEDRRTRDLDQLQARWLDLAAAGDAGELEASLVAFAQDEVRAGRGEPGITAETARDSKGRNLLHTAAWKGQASVVEMLCSRWKQPMQPGPNGEEWSDSTSRKSMSPGDDDDDSVASWSSYG